jgi:ribosomal protein L4
MTMAQTTILKADGAEAGTVDLAETLFEAPVNKTLIHQAVVRQLAGRRIGSADTQTRGEVPEGHRPGAAGEPPRPAMERRRRGVRAASARL